MVYLVITKRGDGLLDEKGGKDMANKRNMECGVEILAVGQEGSMKDINARLAVCAECSRFVSCAEYIHNSKRLTASLENLDVMAKKIREEQQIS